MLPIQKLMTVPPKNRDIQWVKEALQLAIELEWGTIPPYLYAMWSAKDGAGDDPSGVAITFSEIVIEEMLHMGIACNLLAGLGENPKIATMDPEHFPNYPGKLTAGVHADLTVVLQPLTAEAVLKTFMVIEEPETILVPVTGFQASGQKLIGEFYNGIKAAIDAEDAQRQPGGLKFDMSRQIDLSNVFFGLNAPVPATNAKDAKDAIDLIVGQGEGSGGKPFEPGAADPPRPSHFYRYGEMAMRQRLVDGMPPSFTGPEVKLPSIRNTTSNPTADPSIPEHAKFNGDYSEMLRQLEKAWAVADVGALGAARGLMGGLGATAQTLMDQHDTGPTFTYIPEAAPPPTPPPPPVDEKRFARVKAILDTAVAGQNNIGPHGPFWRGLTRDQFVAKKVFQQQLVVPGNTADSKILNALRGQAPFGADIGTAGATFRRMPAGLPPVPAGDIAFIETWIADGCPDDPPPVLPPGAPAEMFSDCTGSLATAEQHVAFWREFDDWAMFHITPDVEAAEGSVFGFAAAWFALAKDQENQAKRDAWTAAISTPQVQGAAAMLSQRQRQTTESHYGAPIPLLALLDGFQNFGADTLPDDPQRPADTRHRMDGAQMWFVWSALAEACITLNVASEFWSFFTRGILCGLLNDGVFRGRYTVNGFAATTEGQLAILKFVQQIPVADLPSELRHRYAESGL